MDDHSNPPHALTEQEIEDRKEDYLELAWLLSECRYKLGLLKDLDGELHQVYLAKISRLESALQSCQTEPQRSSFQDFLMIKYDIRLLLKQLAGLLSCSDWQSPSITQSPIKEKGFHQAEQNVYLRTFGSEYVKRFEQEMFREYYAMSDEARSRSMAFLTISGMKALEAALMAYRLLSKSRLPVCHQVGYYFEGITLLRDLYPDAVPVSVGRIYEMLDNQEEIGCLLLEPGTTWPAHEGVRLDILFEKVIRHRQQHPLFILIDRTLTGVTNPFFEAYADRLPDYVILISIESGIKYWQFGLELTNLGFLVLSGPKMQDPAVQELVIHCMNVLSGVPDPALVQRLPRPSRVMLERRMHRLARNTNRLYRLFEELHSEGRIRRLYHSVQTENRLFIRGEPWNGSLLYAQLPGVVSYPEYERVAADWVERAAPSLQLHLGGSFGFDTMRLCAVEESPEREDNSAIRLSVGRDTAAELERKLQFFRQLFA